MLRRALLIAFALAAACGGKVVIDATPAGSGGAGGATSGCGDDGMPIPAVYKACEVDEQCTIRFVDVDCCGSVAVVGVAVEQLALFAGYQHECNTNAPTCDCAPQPGRTDDGSDTYGGADIEVTCDDGQCTTHAL